jgi:hypothetical protein
LRRTDVRDRNWKEQLAGADELIAVLSERFGALRYGLCHACSDLDDCISRVELKLKARAAARVN